MAAGKRCWAISRGGQLARTRQVWYNIGGLWRCLPQHPQPSLADTPLPVLGCAVLPFAAFRSQARFSLSPNLSSHLLLLLSLHPGARAVTWPARSREGGARSREAAVWLWRPPGMSRKQAAKARPAARKGRRPRHPPAAPGPAPGNGGGLAGQLRALGLKLREVPGDG